MKNQKLKLKENDDFVQIYFDAFSKAISDTKIENYQPNHQKINEKFTLFEDLTIILKLHSPSKISQKKNFQEIALILQRSSMGIRNRYQQYLQHLNCQDFFKIYQFLQKHGIDGQLNFYLENRNCWKLKDISSLSESPIYYLIDSPIQKAKENEQPQKCKSKFKRQNQEDKPIEPQVQKKIKFQFSANSKYDKSSKKQCPFQTEQTILNTEQKQRAEELKYTLKLLSNLLNASYKDLVQKMYQCSGDLNTLLRVFSNRQEGLLWTKEADEALKAYLEQDDLLEKQKLKAILNGEDSIRQRKEWLFE
ncbi:unnamed protein product (macronuclear) [Paramecium tetraurelia]|uniref:Uncharacterized protein n=1 Tax=Paramecium tetraurelia TaxID=5888 RepID=A0E5N9_PARTE|nr:uncharacterized protein GSPATT00003468001 [Paramecium tetraurelia]CAK90606.1 unnamed protein product [Paramecium tetraurelia]|eukprot:XP_001458003.1 hypothetical protein (macronuclear) [Paramecium tetraurelia strain d4-2]